MREVFSLVSDSISMVAAFQRFRHRMVAEGSIMTIAVVDAAAASARSEAAAVAVAARAIRR
ncbi:hypothetical protein A9X00_25610 [Mycobacterium sp. 1245805.9]|nr:hypothetical protein A9X00_25610 [Mycobacterium sp. 1245805.9]